LPLNKNQTFRLYSGIIFESEYFIYNLYSSLKIQKMKKGIISFVIAITVLSVSTVTVYAQQDPAARQAAMKQKLKDDLKLTDVQADSVSAIQQEFRPQMRDIFMDQSMSREDKQAKIKVIQGEADKRIQAVLGDDLFKKYQEWREKNRPQRGGGGGGGNNQ
jgi:hypothetical protein